MNQRAEEAQPEWPSLRRVGIVTVATTLVVTAISHAWPRNFRPTIGGIALPVDPTILVGAVFLAVTWWEVMRGDEAKIRRFGLSLGGVTEPVRIDPQRVFRSSMVALGWAFAFALVIFPPFFFGYRMFWSLSDDFVFRLPSGFSDHVLGQLMVVALPEEAFFRGYLQSALEAHWANRRVRIAGAELGLGMLVTAVVFAVGHLLTIPSPLRLGVFFPALLFGWLRARTGGIGAALVFHAMCNLCSLLIRTAYGY